MIGSLALLFGSEDLSELMSKFFPIGLVTIPYSRTLGILGTSDPCDQFFHLHVNIEIINNIGCNGISFGESLLVPCTLKRYRSCQDPWNCSLAISPSTCNIGPSLFPIQRIQVSTCIPWSCLGLWSVIFGWDKNGEFIGFCRTVVASSVNFFSIGGSGLSSYFSSLRHNWFPLQRWYWFGCVSDDGIHPWCWFAILWLLHQLSCLTCFLHFLPDLVVLWDDSMW